MSRFAPFRFFIAFSLILTGCAGIPVGKSQKAEEATAADLEPVSFADLPGWDLETLDGTLAAMKKSCDVLLKRDPSTPINPSPIAGTVADWTPACTQLKDGAPAVSARAFFEANFTPYKVTTPNGDEGLFTGYYEKVMKGSLTKTAQFNVPLYKRPADLVMVELGDFRPELKGERIAGSVIDGKLKPYADRQAIESGALANKKLELVWVDDANAAFFLHVQGSGRIQLPDGKEMRVGYDGQNGHVYRAIGKELIARGELTPETTNLESIRAWLVAHPDQAAALRWTNPSYIFFKQIDDSADGPMGAQGVALTAKRSLAVDPRFIPYGAPIWLDVPAPLVPDMRIQRLMVAQDTGGAIRGPVRGDFFWGTGDWNTSEVQAAGAMKSRGHMWLLLPKNLQSMRHVELMTKE